MKIGVISDTHGDTGAARQALRILDSFGVKLTIHCGDVGIGVLPLFGGRRVHLVAGNTDDVEALSGAIESSEQTIHESLGTLEIEGCRIAFLHGHDVRLLYQTIHSGHWDLVCYGHTHSFSTSREGKTTVLNAGALSRTLYPSLAIVELPAMEVTQVPL